MNFMKEGSLVDRVFSFLGKMTALNLLWIGCSLFWLLRQGHPRLHCSIVY